MTAGWTGSDLAAGDVAWHAWHRLGVDPFALALGQAHPSVLEDLVTTIAPELDHLTRQVLDAIEVRLYGQARERVVADVRQDMEAHVVWAVVEAIRSELLRPEPVPYAPPPAGAWVRSRWLARPATGRLAARGEPSWDGRWHVFAGDLVTWPHRVNDVSGRTLCGLRITLRSDHQDAVIADAPPGVDACRRCQRSREAQVRP